MPSGPHLKDRKHKITRLDFIGRRVPSTLYSQSQTHFIFTRLMYTLDPWPYVITLCASIKTLAPWTLSEFDPTQVWGQFLCYSQLDFCSLGMCGSMKPPRDCASFRDGPALAPDLAQQMRWAHRPPKRSVETFIPFRSSPCSIVLPGRKCGTWVWVIWLRIGCHVPLTPE